MADAFKRTALNWTRCSGVCRCCCGGTNKQDRHQIQRARLKAELREEPREPEFEDTCESGGCLDCAEETRWLDPSWDDWWEWLAQRED